MKNGNIAIIAIVAMVILAVLFLSPNSPLATPAPQNGNGTPTPTPSAPTPTPPACRATDISVLLLPFYGGSAAQAYCNATGGTWHQTSNWLGCENAPGAAVDCTDATIQIAILQCQSTQSTAVCDAHNYYCRCE